QLPLPCTSSVFRQTTAIAASPTDELLILVSPLTSAIPRHVFATPLRTVSALTRVQPGRQLGLDGLYGPIYRRLPSRMTTRRCPTAPGRCMRVRPSRARLCVRQAMVSASLRAYSRTLMLQPLRASLR